MSDKVNIENLQAWQNSDSVHQFTCGSGNRTDEKHLDGEGVLTPTESGWECPYCDYRQPYGRFEQTIHVQNALTMFMNSRP